MAAYAAKSEHDYRAESDRDALVRAAEIVGDRLRLRAAMGLMRKQKSGMDRMLTVLCKRK